MVAKLEGRRENSFDGSDGKPVSGGILYVSYPDSRCEGLATAEIKLYGNKKPLYDKIKAAKIGQNIDVTYETLPGSRYSQLVDIKLA